MAAPNNFKILIITGFSGAGKSLTANCLEDMGYYCVDNLPPALLSTFVDLSRQSEGKIDKVGLVIDVRGGAFFKDLSRELENLHDQNIDYEILFLEAMDSVLVSRFKESRRLHPLASDGQLLAAIQKEKEMLAGIRSKANIIIDTSYLSARDIKEKVTELFGDTATTEFRVGVISFGFKIGVPMDADIVMDVRFFTNPFYDPEMRHMTGKDEQVINFVLNAPEAQEFIDKFQGLLEFLIPNYIKEGKKDLLIAIGCTGGQHRSVVLTEYIGQKLTEMGYKIIVKHRDLPRYI